MVKHVIDVKVSLIQLELLKIMIIFILRKHYRSGKIYNELLGIVADTNVF